MKTNILMQNKKVIRKLLNHFCLKIIAKTSQVFLSEQII